MTEIFRGEKIISGAILFDKPPGVIIKSSLNHPKMVVPADLKLCPRVFIKTNIKEWHWQSRIYPPAFGLSLSAFGSRPRRSLASRVEWGDSHLTAGLRLTDDSQLMSLYRL